jgi:hypothetical protein
MANDVIGKATIAQFARGKLNTAPLFKSKWITFFLIFLIIESKEKITCIHQAACMSINHFRNSNRIELGR